MSADFVATDEGSGLVHLAPGFGEDDARIGRAEGLPVLNPVGPDGTFDERVTPWAGRYVKDADAGIIGDLRARGLLVAEEPYEHSYPHCWRCGTPLYWAKTSWFCARRSGGTTSCVRTRHIGWHPGAHQARPLRQVAGGQRGLGPLPGPVLGHAAAGVLRQGHDSCIGSVAELEVDRDLSELDLHRPAVDDVTFDCPIEGCGSTSSRLAPVLDAWFDSGSMPSAQHHALRARGPVSGVVPADFICEGLDQTAAGSTASRSTPWCSGRRRTATSCASGSWSTRGQKMSKSRGNVADAWEMFARHGSDAVRWQFFAGGSPWTTRRVSDDGVREGARTTLLTLWNVLSFFATYADLDAWSPDVGRQRIRALGAPRARPLDPSRTGRHHRRGHHGPRRLRDALPRRTRLARFVDDLSNWYLRRSRRRFWKQAEPDAHATLYHTLVTAAQLLAPFCSVPGRRGAPGRRGRSVGPPRNWPSHRVRSITS